MSHTTNPWPLLPLGEIGLPRTPNIDPSSYPNEVFELYSVPSFSSNGPEIVHGIAIRSNKQIVQPGDVLLCKIVPHLVRVWCVPERRTFRQIASGEWIVVRPEDKTIATDYLQYALTEPGFRSQFMETVSGVGGSLMRARPKAVAQIAIPVPTAGEQRRIVAKLDRLFKHTKTAREELSRIPRLVERQRGAILAAAVRGDLTQRWRANNGEINPASTRVPLQSDARSEVLLPKSWTNCRVGEAGEVTLGRQRSPRHHVGKDMRPYLRVANVFEARLDFRDVMEMNFTPSEFERFKLVPGDILLNEGQSKELVGRPAMFNGELDGVCFTNSLVRFRANSSVSAEYSLIVFRHYLRSGLFQTIANITTNIAHLGAGRFAALPFPTPPVAEQNEIVRICRYKFDALEKIASTVGQSSALIKRLEESALTYAFEGQLLM